MELVNLTPHTVNLVTAEGEVVLQPAGQPARVSVSTVQVGTVELSNGVEVPLLEEQFGEVVSLPEPTQGVLFLVSRLVLQACPDRNDLVTVADLVRDEDGRVVGARALAR